MKRYNIINMSIEEVNKALAAGNLESKIIYTSTDRAEIVAKLDGMNNDYSIEEYEENEDGDFVSGTDFDTPSNFIRRYNRDTYGDEAKALLQDASMETIAAYMNDEIREAIHLELAPCSDEDFLTEYLARHHKTYNETFTI